MNRITTMNRTTRQVIPVVAALILSTAWLYGGCSGDITADEPSVPAAEREARGSETPRGAGEESFLSRVFGKRTREVTIPAGTSLELRFSETVSSRDSSAGDAFRAVVQHDIRVGDAVAIPAGSVVSGRVTEAHQPTNVGGRARLSLEFTELELPSGTSVPIDAVFAGRGKSENLKDSGIIAGSTLGGVILGEAVDKGQGGVIGGILGGIGGAVAATKTHGRPVEIASGGVMTVELARSLTLEVPA